MNRINYQGRTPEDVIRIVADLAYNNEIQFTRQGDDGFALGVETNYNTLSAIYKVAPNADSYEYYVPLVTGISSELRGEIAETAISEPFRELTPVMPRDQNSLYGYSFRDGLDHKDDLEIKDSILDDLGRIQGYDNEKAPIFRSILKRR